MVNLISTSLFTQNDSAFASTQTRTETVHRLSELALGMVNGDTTAAELKWELSTRADINTHCAEYGLTALGVTAATIAETITDKTNVIKALKILIKVGADVNVVNNWKATLVMSAIDNVDVELVKFFTEAGVDVNARDIDELAAIDRLVYSHWRYYGDRREKIFALLINAGADVNIVNSRKETFMMNAIEKGSNVLVGLLIEAGADVNARDVNGLTALGKLLAQSNSRYCEYTKNIIHGLLKNADAVS